MTTVKRIAIACNRMTTASPVLASSALLAVVMIISGCSAGSKNTSTTTTGTTEQAGPQTYTAPFVYGDTLPGFSVSAYNIDDTAQTFSKSTYYVGQSNGALQEGARIYYAGTTTKLARGLLSLGANYKYSNGNIVPYSPPQTGSWAVELPNQAGGLIQFLNQPVEPVVAATSCPDFSTPQTYQFLTLPSTMLIGEGGAVVYTWDPTQETVYGSVDISGSGSAIAFKNIQQYALPSFPMVLADGSLGLGPPGAPVFTIASSQTGACSSSYYGNTTVVPGNLTVTDPGLNVLEPPVAVVGIGPTGLLVESNAASGEPDNGPYIDPPFYENLLGAGTGAIGLPKPSSALGTSAVGAQYLGFFYGSGDGNNDWSSYVASFGFATRPSSCGSLATQTSTMIYGGNFGGNNPGAPGTQSNGGFGLCDVAIDLGTEDPSNNGFYPSATVYLGASFAGNGLCSTNSPGPCGTYTIPAVAIAGQLDGKYAIFLLGIDVLGTPNQAWGIYLLQSN